MLQTILDFVMIFGLIIIVGILVQAVFLGIGLGFVNGDNREIGTTFVTALLMGLVGWIPCIGCFISWYFIKSRHNVGWGGALVAWILGGIVMIIVVIAILLMFFAPLIAILMGFIPFP